MKHSRRLKEIVSRTANQACRQPLLEGGLWFHDDIRNNFYYASYLAAGALDDDIHLAMGREQALRMAWEMLFRVLSMQNRSPEDDGYGHWPLNLAPSPAQAKPNPLTAELMGLQMVYFHRRYASAMPAALSQEFEKTFETLYRSSFFRVPIRHYNHHEAKYTAAKLVYGSLFHDNGLMEDGRASLLRILARLKEKGMPEYGGLPWFWHWVQAFVCVLECVENEEVKRDARDLLDFLWGVRADAYLGGAWVGARSRSLTHDLPRDRNVAFDYAQFGDFPLPESLPRVEYAGLLFYPANEETRFKALYPQDRFTESKRVIYPADGQEQARLHSYVYLTDRYAAGGMWERVKEFDNEQHQWEITLPLREHSGVNRLYFFRPGEGYREGDPRHESDGGAVLYHQNVIMALYPPDSRGEDRLIGILPKGKWLCRREALYGCSGGVYFAIYLREGYSFTEEQDRCVVVGSGMPNGVIVEVVGDDEMRQWPASDLASFEKQAESTLPQRLKWSSDFDGLQYVTLRGDCLQLRFQEGMKPVRFVNAAEIDFMDYHSR